MDRAEKELNELLERAAKFGLNLEFDSGLILVRRTESGDPERQDEILAELVKKLGDVRRLIERRAMGVRAQELLGRRVWCEDGEGVLAGSSEDGGLSISFVRSGWRHTQTVTTYGAALLIVVQQEEADAAPSAGSNEQKSAQAPKGFLERARDRLRGD